MVKQNNVNLIKISKRRIFFHNIIVVGTFWDI